MVRRFRHSPIEELEAAFVAHRSESGLLRQLLYELKHRNSERELALREEIEVRLRALGTVIGAGPDVLVSAPELAGPGAATAEPAAQTPEGVLSAWMALETLSALTYHRPEDLAGGDRRAVVSLEDPALPWERVEKSRSHSRHYYQVVLGSIDMASVLERTAERFRRASPTTGREWGRAVLAVVMVDRQGRLAPSPAIAVASFGWAVMLALEDDLAELLRWPQVGAQMAGRLEERLLGAARNGQGGDERGRCITRSALMEGYHALLTETGLTADMVEPPAFAIRTHGELKDSKPPELLPVNSVYLDDLAAAQALFEIGEAPALLKRYLAAKPPRTRRDLLRDHQALDDALAPAMTPLARWPRGEKKSSTLLEQAAVNLAISETEDGGLLGVNGPRETSQADFLKDLAACVVAARAEAMCRFDDPAAAFAPFEEKMQSEAGAHDLFRIDPSLRGFEIVLAGSGRKAAAGFSSALCRLGAIPEDAIDLRYFKSLGDAMHRRETWGLFSAAAGEIGVRGIEQAFWLDEEIGMRSYLAAVADEGSESARADPFMNGHLGSRIVREEAPPRSRGEAIARWESARLRFNEALAKSRGWQQWLELIRGDLASVQVLAVADGAARITLNAAIAQERAAAETRRAADAELMEAAAAAEVARHRFTRHNRHKPGFLTGVFPNGSSEAWTKKRDALQSELDEAESRLEEAERTSRKGQQELRRATDARQQEEIRWTAQNAIRVEAEKGLEEARAHFGVVLGDASFYEQPAKSMHESTLWLNEQAQEDREEVFMAAVALHRAFIDAAAAPLRKNLDGLMGALSGRSQPEELLLAELWATLFLVVPVLSMPLASVGRMLGELPPESLGWLVVEDSGTALPQSAVGALLRARRAIMLGDSALVPPSVMLPEPLIRAVCRRFGVDANTFSAPANSVHELGNAASGFASVLSSK